MDDIVKLIREGKLSQKQKCDIAEALGETETKLLRTNCDIFHDIYKNRQSLQTYTQEQFLQQVHPVLYKFITSIAGQSKIDIEKVNLLCCTFENVYKL